MASLRPYPDQPEFAEAQRQLLQDIRETKPSRFDTHPTYVERVAAVEQFPDSSETPDTSPATEMLSGFARIEEQLTELLTGYVYDTCDIVQIPEESRAG